MDYGLWGSMLRRVRNCRFIIIIIKYYHCAKFGDFSFRCFGFIVRTDRITDKMTDRTSEADDRYTHATTVGVTASVNRNRQNKAKNNQNEKCGKCAKKYNALMLSSSLRFTQRHVAVAYVYVLLMKE